MIKSIKDKVIPLDIDDKNFTYEYFMFDKALVIT
jgi:hypothetical protein